MLGNFHRAAVTVDQGVFRAALPDGDGAALLQRDVERVGQTALDGGARHPVDRLELLPRGLQVYAEQGIARPDVERGQDGALLDIVAALDRDVGQLEGRDGADHAARHGIDAVAGLDQPALVPGPPAAAPAASQQQHDEAQHHRLAPQRPGGLVAERAALPAPVVVTPWRRELLGGGAHVGCLA